MPTKLSCERFPMTIKAQLKSLKINPLLKTLKCAMKSEMASLSNYWLQNSKERPNQSTNNGDMAEITKRSVSM